MTRDETLVRLADGEAALRDVRAYLEALDAPEATPATSVARDPASQPTAPALLAWGGKVSQTFRDRIVWLAQDLDIGPAPGKPEPSWVMTWIAWESGRTFAADVKNMAGSGATGLIQHMPSTAIAYFHTADEIQAMSEAQREAAGLAACERLAAMTAEDQVNYVWRYFKPWKGRIRTLADGYMCILWPKAVGQPEGYVLWDKASRPTTYRQNAGLDIDHDGTITKAEAAAKVSALLPEGMKQGNAA